MAGGASIVRRDAQGNEIQQFGGNLPSRGHGTADRPRLGGGVVSAVTHDDQLERVLTTMYGVNLYDDPIRFAELNGLTVTDQASIAAVHESPDIVRAAIVDMGKQMSMARASGGRVRATTATGSDYRGRKAMFAIASHLLG
ncbi:MULTISPECIES: hypothetical protein [unclassified Caballeronia]|uniref:hypothetical protein n=1 Tax=unclassified Caballeronia TaxID=2646786 RepID=UPI00285D1F19|nr:MULTISPECIES: hypothetical protein [unclassified Caballeronia]MDR5771800.1 hypothetical protein [Caballeronia sp. LZ002]MDR5847235.1 hypothetical protein [Caballeronia sp. LZ003]